MEDSGLLGSTDSSPEAQGFFSFLIIYFYKDKVSFLALCKLIIFLYISMPLIEGI